MPQHIQTFITTFMENHVDFLNPDPKTIQIEDIAHALALIPRFGGHTGRLYSVAQHSIHVAELCPPELKLISLMHDANEAYLGDIITPIKNVMPGFRALEDRFHAVICERFEISRIIPEEVRRADALMLAMEARDLMHVNPKDWGMDMDLPPQRIIPWEAERAKAYFLDQFRTFSAAHRSIEYGRGLRTAVGYPEI